MNTHSNGIGAGPADMEIADATSSAIPVEKDQAASTSAAASSEAVAVSEEEMTSRDYCASMFIIDVLTGNMAYTGDLQMPTATGKFHSMSIFLARQQFTKRHSPELSPLATLVCSYYPSLPCPLSS